MTPQCAASNRRLGRAQDFDEFGIRHGGFSWNVVRHLARVLGGRPGTWVGRATTYGRWIVALPVIVTSPMATRKRPLMPAS